MMAMIPSTDPIIQSNKAKTTPGHENSREKNHKNPIKLIIQGGNLQHGDMKKPEEE